MTARRGACCMISQPFADSASPALPFLPPLSPFVLSPSQASCSQHQQGRCCEHSLRLAARTSLAAGRSDGQKMPPQSLQPWATLGCTVCTGSCHRCCLWARNWERWGTKPWRLSEGSNSPMEEVSRNQQCFDRTVVFLLPSTVKDPV